jgi:hypothetical protein
LITTAVSLAISQFLHLEDGLQASDTALEEGSQDAPRLAGTIPHEERTHGGIGNWLPGNDEGGERCRCRSAMISARTSCGH